MTTQLESMYQHEARRPDALWLTQPMGQGRVLNLTFSEAMGEARKMAAYLGSLGLPPGSNIALFSKNTAWWFLADLAIWMAGHVSVPLYPTLTPKTVSGILEHSGARLIFIGKLDDFASMEPGIPASLPRVVMPLGPATRGTRWEDAVAGRPPLAGNPAPDPDALATLIYTSGSTGAPKGVMHSFRTMCAARILAEQFAMTRDDRVISYLPLAHTAERAGVETTAFLIGYRVFFAESPDTFLADVRRARPTLFVSVPRLWVKLQAGVHEKLPAAKLQRLLRLPVIGRMVRAKVRKGLGLDQARAVATGSAPIPAEVVAWYRELGLKMFEVYAMSENFAVSHLMRPETYRPNHVGRPLPGVEHRLSEQQELLVKSPGTMLGYYEAEDATRQAIDAEGWLHTGDRGEIAPDGQLRITGRVKEIFKTAKGKYVAPAPIENLLLSSGLFEQACVAGANMPQPFAMVVRSPAPASPEQLESALAEVNARVDPHERLERLVVVKEEWTTGNGLLTPTLKLRRGAIEEFYAPKVGAWYAAPGPVVVEAA